MTTKYSKAALLTEDQKTLLETLLDSAKKIREGYKYSEDERMRPTAFIVKPDGMDIVSMEWSDEKEKYRMAAAANAMARQAKAECLAFATDSRWLEGTKFAEYYRLDPISKTGVEKFQREYHRILAAHGGQIKNLPRELWEEAITVFANGPDFPLTVKMAHYKEGANDKVEWIEDRLAGHDHYKSDLLTDWWK